jgi:hypothetical protein
VAPPDQASCAGPVPHQRQPADEERGHPPAAGSAPAACSGRRDSHDRAPALAGGANPGAWGRRQDLRHRGASGGGVTRSSLPEGWRFPPDRPNPPARPPASLPVRRATRSSRRGAFVLAAPLVGPATYSPFQAGILVVWTRWWSAASGSPVAAAAGLILGSTSSDGCPRRAGAGCHRPLVEQIRPSCATRQYCGPGRRLGELFAWWDRVALPADVGADRRRHPRRPEPRLLIPRSCAPCSARSWD